MNDHYDEPIFSDESRHRPARERTGSNFWLWGCGGCAFSLFFAGVLVVAAIVAGVNWLGDKVEELGEYLAGQPVFAKHLPRAPRSVAYSPDGQQIATSSDDGTIHVWNVETAKSTQTFKVVKGHPLPLAFHPKGTHIAIGGQTHLPNAVELQANPPLGGGTVWDIATGKMLFALEGGHTRSVMDIAYSPDGSRLATAAEDGTARVWDANTGKELLALKGATNSVSFSPDGRQIVTATSSTVHIWDAVTGEELRKIEVKVEEPKAEPKTPKVDPKTQKVIPKTAKEDAKTLKDEAKTPEGIPVVPPVAARKRDVILCVRFVENGKQILACGWSGFWLWEANGKLIRTGKIKLPADSSFRRTRAIHPATKQVVAAFDNSVHVYEATTGKLKQQFYTKPKIVPTLSSSGVWCVAISPDGTQIVGGSLNCEIRIWNLKE